METVKSGVDGVHAIIMCKAPVVGGVKTRLTSVYSETEAAEIHQAMAGTVIRRTASMFSNCRIAADDVLHPFFESFGLPLVAQGEGDLGARMSRLMVDAFNSGAQAVLFLGTDSPHMESSRLTEAVKQLETYDVVVGPVEDGGYDLIAMKRPHIELFTNIRWGSEHVLDETRQRAKASGISTGLLAVSFDLDTPESLERAKPLWAPAND